MAKLTASLVLLLAAAYGTIETHGIPRPSPTPPNEICGTLPEEAINVTVACIQKLGIKELDLERFSADAGKAIDPNYDDKCLSKCIFVEAGLMTEEGETILEAFKTDFKKFKTEKYQQYLETTTSTCISFAENQFASSGGAKGNVCKFASTLAQCFAGEEFKICHPEGSKSK